MNIVSPNQWKLDDPEPQVFAVWIIISILKMFFYLKISIWIVIIYESMEISLKKLQLFKIHPKALT